MSILGLLQSAAQVPGAEIVSVTIGVVGGQTLWKILLEKLLDRVTNGNKASTDDVVREIRGLRQDIHGLQQINDLKRENAVQQVISEVRKIHA